MFLHSQCIEWLKLWTSFVSFHSASTKNTTTQHANFALFLSNGVISNFPLFFFSFFSRFYLIGHTFFFLKIWNYRQWSFSLPFNMPNLHLSLDIRHVDLRTSRVLWPYLGSVSICWIINIYIFISICLWRKGINKLRFHPDKPVSWLPTHQGI